VPMWLREVVASSSPVAGAPSVPFAQLMKSVGGKLALRKQSLRTMEQAMKAGEGRATGWDPLRLDSFGGNPEERKKFARFWAAVSPNTDTAMSNAESLKAQEAHLATCVRNSRWEAQNFRTWSARLPANRSVRRPEPGARSKR
jgi:hypothetical protein